MADPSLTSDSGHYQDSVDRITARRPRVAVRTLPLRLQPVMGESVESWLEALASRSGTTWGEMLTAVGLHGESNRVRVARFTVSPTPEQLAALSYATGVAPSVITSMTSSSLFGSATAGAMTAGPFASSRSRFCPKCLADSGGRWQLWWKLRWAFACPVHHCLLADVCPRCGGHQRRRPLPQSLIPQPGQCTCRAKDSWGRCLQRCGALLSTAQTVELTGAHPAMDAQNCLLAAMATGAISSGIYTKSPVSSLQFVTDLTVLAQQIVWHAPAEDIRDWAPRDVWNIDEDRVIRFSTSDRPSTTLWLAHDSSATVALAACVALPILQAPSAAAAAKQMRKLLLSTKHASFTAAATAIGWGRKVSMPLAGVQSSALAPFLHPIDPIRKQARAPDPSRPDRRIQIHQSVPAWLWPQWALQIDAPGLGAGELRMVLSVALLLVGSDAGIRSACAQLGSFTTVHAVKRVLGVLSSQSDWATTVSMLTYLADLLETGVCPIDYQRRRQLFVTDLLPDREWERLCRDLATPADDATRAYLCRWWLYERITGSPTRRGPPTGEGTRFWRMYCELPATLSPEEVTALDCCGRRFLDAQGMENEPLCWQPPSMSWHPIASRKSLGNNRCRTYRPAVL